MNLALKILGGLALTSTLFAFKKRNDFAKVIESMTYDIRNIRNLRLRSGKLFLNLDLGFHNQTDLDMTIYTAGLIKLKSIKLFYKGKEMGSTIIDAAQFELPAKSNYLIENIEIELLLLNFVNQMLNFGLDTEVKNYSLELTIQALNKTWVMK